MCLAAGNVLQVMLHGELGILGKNPLCPRESCAGIFGAGYLGLLPPPPLLAVGPRVGYLNLLGFSFLIFHICEMGQ